MTKTLLLTAALLAGAAAIVIGVGLIYFPAALITGGLFAIVAVRLEVRGTEPTADPDGEAGW